jgi:SAM-dependent methyltransferase
VLTVRFDQLGVRPGDRVLDLGCGFGRHAFAAYRLGAAVVACDLSLAELKDVTAMFAAVATAERDVLSTASWGAATNGDATALPFGDGSFDHVIASEVLEHVGDDVAALAELSRVLKPGGTLAVTVPAQWPERVCWALSEEYHAPYVVGGHVRIYSEARLRRRLRDAGLRPVGAHHAHALHTPYWWLKCAVGPADDDHPLVRAYHEVLVADIVGRQPIARITRLLDRLANPILGKSLVVYARKRASTHGGRS